MYDTTDTFAKQHAWTNDLRCLLRITINTIAMAEKRNNRYKIHLQEIELKDGTPLGKIDRI